MTIQDPIADMLCRIRNSLARAKAEARMPSSKLKVAIADILRQEGYIADYRVETDGSRQVLCITLKYFEGRPVIELLQRVSKPGLRRYGSSNDMPVIKGGYGTTIVSTSRGVMTDKKARALGIGGEILCVVA